MQLVAHDTLSFPGPSKNYVDLEPLCGSFGVHQIIALMEPETTLTVQLRTRRGQEGHENSPDGVTGGYNADTK
jgi:hypothetical protein